MFDKVVFAGGGHRCWWQAGFWDQVTGEIELHPRVIGGVGAGAVMACLLYGNDSRRALAWYERELAGVRTNISWFNLARRGQRLMPHAAIQRKALRALLGGEGFRQLMWRAPEIRVQFTRPPPGMAPARAVLRALFAARLAGSRSGNHDSAIGERLGFINQVRRVQDCRGERELVDLLVASCSRPPFSPVESIDGEPCMDGSLVDEVPIGAVADVPGQTLVLTTRRSPGLAPTYVRDGRMYVQPSERVPVASWDTTSSARLQNTYDLGRRDGEQFLRMFALGQYRETSLRAAQVPAAAAAATAEKQSRSEDALPDEDPERPPPEDGGRLDVRVKLAAYRDPTEAGIADDLSASQPGESQGHVRSGRSLRASNI
jgi:predicted acylesterase/phospholipase RssA